MSSVNGMPNFNSQVFAQTGTQAKKKGMTKWIVIIIIILCVLYFFRNSRSTRSANRLTGETCRYSGDCKNKYCKCRNGGAVCSRYNRVCG